jgi:hypothetical protein
VDEPIKVKCEHVEDGPRFAIVMGRKAITKGLWLRDDWKTCFLFERGRHPVIAEHIQYTPLHFGGRRQIHPRDLETAQRLGFKVASGWSRTFSSGWRTASRTSTCACADTA